MFPPYVTVIQLSLKRNGNIFFLLLQVIELTIGYSQLCLHDVTTGVLQVFILGTEWHWEPKVLPRRSPFNGLGIL